MLTQQSTREEAAGMTRRWYADAYFDLFLWQNADGSLRSFQLCYDKLGRERALHWTVDRGLDHHAVDDGEARPTENRAPVMVADAEFPVEVVRREFEVRSVTLAAEIREMVLEKIGEHANERGGAETH